MTPDLVFQDPYLLDFLGLKKEETVEYMDLGRNGIHVAEYITELPPRDVLRAQFHEALKRARQRLLERGVAEE